MRKNFNTIACHALIMLVAVGALPSFAQDDGSRIDELETRLARLEVDSDSRSSLLQSTSIGAHGGVTFGYLRGSKGAEDVKEIDVGHFVLGITHDFNEKIRLISETELEYEKEDGKSEHEIGVENLFVEFDLNSYYSLQVGVFLLPVGLLNENDEPTRFYGVKFNPVEDALMPESEGGVGLVGALSEYFDFFLYIHSGLNTTATDGYVPSEGSQRVAKADASRPSAT